MLTRWRLEELARGPSGDMPQVTIEMLVDEIKAQRKVVLAALACTGEDGHDGFTDLVCEAEAYLETLAKDDRRWTSDDRQTRDAVIQERTL